MPNIMKYTIDTYTKHLLLILVFSLAFVIAFIIPVFASFPTFNDAGGIFVRLTSVLTNLTPFTTAVIIFSTLFSLLFLSFAIVAINLIVKHSRTSTRIRKEVMDGLEKYTAKVFGVLLLYTIIVFAVSMFNFLLGISSLYSYLIGLVITPFFFYAPAAIVIDEQKTGRSLTASLRFFFKRLDYFVLWLVLAIVLLTLFDFIFIAATGTLYSRYITLIFDALFILPFLVVLQSQCYMRRFALLKR